MILTGIFSIINNNVTTGIIRLISFVIIISYLLFSAKEKSAFS